MNWTSFALGFGAAYALSAVFALALARWMGHCSQQGT